MSQSRFIVIAMRCHRVAFLFRMSLQEDAMVDTGRELFLIVSNHDHRLVFTLAERLDDITRRRFLLSRP